MAAFADGQLLQFTQAAFVASWLADQVGLLPLFNLVYAPQDIQVQQLTLGAVRRKEFQRPVFETVHTRGVDEQIVPTTSRTKIDRARSRAGRLAWVDVYLDVLLAASVASLASPIDHITSGSLLDKLGPVASLDDLRAKLGALYAPSVVDAYFRQLRITTLDDFLSRPSLFLQFVYQAPPPYNPGDPAAAQEYPLNVCVQVREDVLVREALQAAKLCRNVLVNEGGFVDFAGGADVITPYAFVVVFPDGAVTDPTPLGISAAQFKAEVQALFAAEHMLAFFA
ncbi:MAG TPA: hypothetical protein VFE78_09010 [Gemmataceae bacterium]|jgi:hypothetical protein|nr:hypothetical protein [Gemmataceae bacterium]